MGNTAMNGRRFQLGTLECDNQLFGEMEFFTGYRCQLDIIAEEPLEVAGLRLEPASHRVTGDGLELKVGPTEFRLLRFFMARPERVMTRQALLDGVWGDHVFIEERTVDVHVRRLRLALEPSGHDALVETVRGGGYRLRKQPLR